MTQEPTQHPSREDADQLPTGQQGGSVAGDGADPRTAELTADLQRLSAEYANYRKRAERDRHAAAAQARAEVVQGLLPALDTLNRAEEHGELTGALRAVSDTLTTALTEAGLQRLGQDGAVFDPALHAAVEHQHSNAAEEAEPTVTRVHRYGYQLGEQVLRPALVAVTEPEPDSVAAATKPDTTVDGDRQTVTADDSDHAGGEVS